MVLLKSSAMETDSVAIRETVANILELIPIAPRSIQLLIGGPNFGWVINQSCSFSEPRAKQKAESSRNGTVGQSGRKIPITAKQSVRNPDAIQRYRMSV